MLPKITADSLEDSLEYKITTDLMKEYQQKIYIYCYNILRNPHDAEDAVQEVFFKAYQSNNLTNIDNIGAWLYKIAYHHCLNQIRRKSLVKLISFTDKEKNSMIQEQFNSDGLVDIELDWILSKLNPKERALIVLRIVEDKDFNEIASIMGISSYNARKRFERVKVKIQKIIERSVENEGKN